MNETRLLTVQSLYDALEARLPKSQGFDWDNDGLAVCPDPDAPVSGVLICLDPTEDALAAAYGHGYNVILSHHPLLFRGLKAVDGQDTSSRKVIDMIRAGVSAMSFHTRLDTAAGGVNDVLAAALGLCGVTPFGDDGNPAGLPIGRIGSLPAPEPFEVFAARLKKALHLPAVVGAGCGKPVSRVAVLGGAGDDDVAAAKAAGADTYVTGELRYHQLCDAPFSGMNLFAAGHYHTEFPVTAVLERIVREISAEAGVTIPVTVIGSSRVQIL